jgi:excinuclease UvrABC helicase subunit UvrB
MYDLMFRNRPIEISESEEPKSKSELELWLANEIKVLSETMKSSAEELRFEEAAAFRDQISQFQRELRELKEV